MDASLDRDYSRGMAALVLLLAIPCRWAPLSGGLFTNGMLAGKMRRRDILGVLAAVGPQAWVKGVRKCFVYRLMVEG